ncbi:MAG: hypothetical protein Q9184_002399 [Pyrenodesmia sp. 2 TL-2023]
MKENVTQAFNFQTNPQIQGDDDGFGTQGRKTKQKKEAEEKVSKIKVYRGPQALELYLQSLQFILWKQCYTLIYNMGLPQEFEDVVKGLWALRLDKIDLGTEEAILHSSQETSRLEMDSQGGRGKERLSRTKPVPSLIDSLATCYLGIVILRLPISLGDLHQWAYKEDITYVRAVRFVPTVMKEKLPAQYLEALDTQSILEVDDIRKAVQELSLFYNQDVIKLTMPAINHPLLLFRYIRDLALPLEIYPTVRRTAKLLNVNFSFSQSNTRQKVSYFPEVALMAFLVIAVKIYYPFDTIDRHPRSLNDPGALAMDWEYWCQLQHDHDSRATAGGKLGRGNEIKVTESETFGLSGDQVDEYLDWFEKTYVDEQRARNHPRGYPEQLLDIFPTGKPGGSIKTPIHPEMERQTEEKALQHKLKAVQENLKLRKIIPDQDGDDVPSGEPINRLGSYYKRYRKVEALNPSAKSFHQAAAGLIAIKLHTLLVAVTQVESKLLAFRKRQLKAVEESGAEEAGSQNEGDETE